MSEYVAVKFSCIFDGDISFFMRGGSVRNVRKDPVDFIDILFINYYN